MGISNEFSGLQSFKTAQVVPRNGHKILETMAGELETMFRLKIGAVEVKQNDFHFGLWFTTELLIQFDVRVFLYLRRTETSG